MVAAIEATAVEIGTEIAEEVIGTVAIVIVIVTTAAQMQDQETSDTLTVSPSSS